MDKHILRTALSIVSITGLDGILKKLAEKKLKDAKKKSLFGGKVVLQLLHNEGAALGALRKRKSLLLALQGAFLGMTAKELFTFHDKKRRVERVGLILVIGGGLSNLLDRIKQGFVTDYVSFELDSLPRGLKKIVFNLSDGCVFFGGLLWLLQRMSKSRS